VASVTVPRTCSGAMKAGVPMATLALVGMHELTPMRTRRARGRARSQAPHLVVAQVPWEASQRRGRFDEVLKGGLHLGQLLSRPGKVVNDIRV
jgi:hypothetical protein